MSEYYSTRKWKLKEEANGRDLEDLVRSGVVEILRWVPGVKRLHFGGIEGEPGLYSLTLIFSDQSAYQKWRQFEEEGGDYWERYASVMIHWEQMAQIEEEYSGEVIMEVALEQER